jgi:hypothetical protein
VTGSFEQGIADAKSARPQRGQIDAGNDKIPTQPFGVDDRLRAQTGNHGQVLPLDERDLSLAPSPLD